MSRFLLFPNGCWHALIDFAERELDADKRALKLINEREPLIGAIVKIGAGVNRQKPNIQSGGRKTPFLSTLDSFRRGRRIFNEFLSSGIMVGYTHPLITERIKRIQTIELNESSC